MRFLVVVAAVLGYASAGVLSPLVLGVNHGDAQAAAIDTAVALQDNARAIGEAQARTAEAVVQANTEAVRQAAEANRDINENVYWGSVAASQNLVAAAQTQAAAYDGAAAAARGALLGHGAPLIAAAPLGIAPLGINHLGLANPWALGLRHW